VKPAKSLSTNNYLLAKNSELGKEERLDTREKALARRWVFSLFFVHGCMHCVSGMMHTERDSGTKNFNGKKAPEFFNV
jgi:hypothetical protein